MKRIELKEEDLTFKVLHTPEELDEAFSLRFRVFCEEMRVFESEEYPDGRETDDYDTHSIHVALLKQGEIVAYTRLVLPTEEFPVERSSRLPPLFDREKSVETSRALVVKEWRHSNAIWILFNRVYAFCQKEGFETILSFSNSVMFNGFKKRGVPFRYVGEPISFHGHKSYPLIIEVDEHITPNFY